jgi:hypothetical protein
MDPRYPIDEQPDEGRSARGRRLTGVAWSVIRQRRALWVLPLLSAFFTALAAAAIFVPVLSETADEAPRVSLFAATAASAFPLTLISTFFNVAFLHVVDAHLDGRELRARDGLRHARSRLGTILAWSLMTTLVGVALRALEVVRGGEIAGRLLSALGGLAWALATFFVVPALALEPIGARKALRRSAGTFRKRWGEQVSGQIAIGGALILFALPGMVALVMALIAFDDGDPTGGAIGVVVAALLVAPPVIAASAVTEVFALVLYRHTQTGVAPGPFSEADLAAAFQPRKRGVLSRLRDK